MLYFIAASVQTGVLSAQSKVHLYLLDRAVSLYLCHAAHGHVEAQLHHREIRGRFSQCLHDLCGLEQSVAFTDGGLPKKTLGEENVPCKSYLPRRSHL